MNEAAKHNWLVRGLTHFTEGLGWITRQLADPVVRRRVYLDLGLKPPADGVTFPDMKEHFDSIDGYLSTEDVTAEQMKSTLEEMRAVYQAIRDFAANNSGLTLEAFDAIMRLLSMNFVRLRFPYLYWIAQPLLLLDDTVSSGVLPGEVTGAVTGAAKSVYHNIGAFFENPYTYVKSIPLPSLQTEDDAQVISNIFALPVTYAFAYLARILITERRFDEGDVEILYGWEPDPASQTPIADRISKRLLSLKWASAKPDSQDHIQGSTIITLALIPRDHGGPGLLASFGGSGTVATVLGDWKLKSTITSSSAFSVIFKSDSELDGPSDAGYAFSFQHVPNPNGLPQIIDVGAARLEFGDFKVTIGFDSQGLQFHALAAKSAFVIDTKGDAVLKRGAGSTEKLRVQLDAGIAYSAGKFSVAGGSSLLVTLPMNLTLGPLQFRGLTLGLIPNSADDQPPFTLELSATIVITISVVVLTVDRLGLVLKSNALEDLSLTSKGVGIAIKSDAFQGGGYLFFDHTNSTYAGTFDLSVKDRFTLKVIGMLVTKLNGQKIFSLFIAAAVTGLDIPLPLEFRLTGLGLLIGLDRDIDLTTLEAGVKAHMLDNLLFPADPVANAPAIINAAATVFPPSPGHTVAGAMVQICWGPTDRIRIEVAVAVKWPGFKLVILGKLRAFAPTEKNPICKLIFDLLIDYDGSAGRFFGYLSANGSKLAELTISGEGALLIENGTPSTFVFSLGGFNARYLPLVPGEFPSLQRVKLSVKKSDSMKVEATFYIAHTTHSTQIGGSLLVALKAGKFGVEGSISVDALFENSEPTFIFDLKAKLELKAWDVTLFLVSVSGSFAGWHPKHVTAKATFEIFIFSHTFSIDKCWGDSTHGTVEQAVDVTAQFVTALSDPGSWNAGLPAAAQSLVTLRAGRDPLLVHPLSTLRVLQRVVPLGIPIERFGTAPVQGQTLFRITGLKVAGTDVSVNKVQEQFARSQFLNMTDDQKLSTPAFELMDAGVEMPAAPLSAGPAVSASMQYQTLVYNAATSQAEPDTPYLLPAGHLIVFAGFGAAAKASAKRTGTIRYKGFTPPVALQQLTFVITSTDDLTAAPVTGGTSTSFTAATTALKAHLQQNPGERQSLQVSPAVK